jgi:hypothetical protein
MRNAYCFDTIFNKINISAVFPRMEIQHGEGELEIENQGRLVISNFFTQETVAIGQQAPRNGELRPKLRESSAGCTKTSDSTPQFFSLSGVADDAA